ncbi:MAG: alcohol dehydrogenase catalytic domain-containing protein [Candidatus Atribacteria bacterium]|nr:alcohol dehydrogenase catalytic domain-containing protein [Candidatus Atribacteria bacterium]
MKALVLHQPGNLKYETHWPVPDVPEGWVLVKMKYTGVCGSDLPRIMVTGAHRHPLICGHELSGTIYRSKSSFLQPGQRVAVLPLIPCGKCEACQNHDFFHCQNYDFIGSRRDGGFAEFCLVPENNVFLLPDTASLEVGAFFEPLLVTLHVLRASRMKPGARLLVIGAGAIGNLSAQWGKILEAGKIFITDIRKESLDIARKCGIDTLDSLNGEIEQQGPYDVVIEAAGSNTALELALRNVHNKGTVVVVGRETKDTIVSHSVFESFMRKEAELTGCWGYVFEGEEAFITRILQENHLCVSSLITHRVTLESGVETIQAMWDKSFFYCKVIFQGEDQAK